MTDPRSRRLQGAEQDLGSRNCVLPVAYAQSADCFVTSRCLVNAEQINESLHVPREERQGGSFCLGSCCCVAVLIYSLPPDQIIHTPCSGQAPQCLAQGAQHCGSGYCAHVASSPAQLKSMYPGASLPGFLSQLLQGLSR